MYKCIYLYRCFYDKRRNYNASIAAQRAWSILTDKQKEILRKRYRQDPDKDNVPTGFDCKPYNFKKQEAFLAEDLKYVNNHKVIPLKTTKNSIVRLGKGTNGEIYKVKNNDNVVLKIGKSKA